MTPKERAAMQQALGALVRAEDMYGQPNADIQTALRDVLAEPDMNLSCKSVQARLATSWGYVKAAQAEQKPVGYFAYDEENEIWEELTRPDALGATPLYAAPVSIQNKSETDSSSSSMRTTVRTKDLTDDEIERALDAAKVPELPDGYKSVDLEIARAVIAADREKNK